MEVAKDVEARPRATRAAWADASSPAQAQADEQATPEAFAAEVGWGSGVTSFGPALLPPANRSKPYTGHAPLGAAAAALNT